jgi:hypothetical protein
MSSNPHSGVTCLAFPAYSRSSFVERELGGQDFMRAIMDEIGTTHDEDLLVAAFDAQLPSHSTPNLKRGDPVPHSYQVTRTRAQTSQKHVYAYRTPAHDANEEVNKGTTMDTTSSRRFSRSPPTTSASISQIMSGGS